VLIKKLAAKGKETLGENKDTKLEFLNVLSCSELKLFKLLQQLSITFAHFI
jgi:hypothetical protein